MLHLNSNLYKSRSLPAPSLIGTKRKADDEAESSPNIEKRLRGHTLPREAVQPRPTQIPINAAFFTAEGGEPFDLVDGQLESKKQGRKEAGATKNKAQGERTIRRGEDEDKDDLMDEEEDEDKRVDGVKDTRRGGEVSILKGKDKGKGKARDDEVTGEEDDGSGFNGCSSEEVNEAIQFVRRSMAPASESSRHGMQVSIYPCVRHFTSVCLT